MRDKSPVATKSSLLSGEIILAAFEIRICKDKPSKINNKRGGVERGIGERSPTRAI